MTYDDQYSFNDSAGWACSEPIHRLENGAIDLAYYDARSRRLRGNAFRGAARSVAGMARRLFCAIVRRRRRDAATASDLTFAPAE